MFLDTVVYKGTRFNEKVIFDVKTTETLQHTLPLVTHRFIKRVWGNCFKIQKNAWWLMMYRCYQHNLKDKLQSEIIETHRNPKSALLKQNRARKEKKCCLSWHNRELKNHDEVHDDDVCWLGKDWNENVSFGRKSNRSVGRRRLHWM